MHKQPHSKHETQPPSLRQIRRTCNQELYRAVKRLKMWVPPEKTRQAEKLYLSKVVANLHWVVENRNNRSKLCDWWDEEVCPEIAELWEIRPERLALAFRNAFGG